MILSELESYFGEKLPRTYIEFLITHNKEMDGDVYLYLSEDLIERNECYQTKEYASGFVNIGDNGGGEAFILKLGEGDPEVSIVGHGSMDPKLREFVCESFSSWITSGFKYEDE